MYSQYGITTKTNIKIKTILSLLTDAYKKEVEDRLWQQWLVDYSNMDKDHFTSFENYKKDVFTPKVALDKDKIIENAERIKKADQGRR